MKCWQDCRKCRRDKGDQHDSVVLYITNSYYLTERKYCGKMFLLQCLFSIHFVGLFVVKVEERTARYFKAVFKYTPCDALFYTYNERSSSEDTRKLPMACIVIKRSFTYHN